ncbi:hypothetical protein FZI91_20265 [Mycobacterium sp. CBMA271]|uniref:hypothetical protein n=1 Tax=unclassified Mycobacteroides TaxID=2618759 RepID=UPI0012DBE898|nr:MULTISPECIES: hypothetical protein [unclassified Mycobacteroides]MUM16989.1 hypothetical protein [Mycobacteroides sp. CBMA 326]MUM24023.1 hypothetical protein [Mycobacteroides sp. CBMA 271]
MTDETRARIIDDAGRYGLAAANPGVNSDILSPGKLVDVSSGNAAVNGIPVTVSAAVSPVGPLHH